MVVGKCESVREGQSEKSLKNVKIEEGGGATFGKKEPIRHLRNGGGSRAPSLMRPHAKPAGLNLSRCFGKEERENASDLRQI